MCAFLQTPSLVCFLLSKIAFFAKESLLSQTLPSPVQQWWGCTRWQFIHSGRHRVMQVFRVLRSPEPRLGLLGNQRSLVTVAPLPTPPVLLFWPCSVSSIFLSSSSLLPSPSVALSDPALGMLGNPPTYFPSCFLHLILAKRPRSSFLVFLLKMNLLVCVKNKFCFQRHDRPEMHL